MGKPVTPMRILLTGDRGYIGSVLAEVLLQKKYDVVGLDAGYFSQCVLYPPENIYQAITADLRDVQPAIFQGMHAVIHLAGLSNDPLGELAPHLTDQINREGAVRLAQLAKQAGVQRFVYASSQSMYGVSDTDAELDEDNSAKNPITAYARTKWQCELAIKDLASEQFVVVCLRPSTVFGASPRLRCDIVFNNLVACAYTTGKIEIKSDGTPWRPVVHVRDVCNAFVAALEAPAHLVNRRSYNVGIRNGNFTVRELAEAAQRAVPGSALIFTGEHGNDSRTYRVCFGRILTELKDYFRPEWDLDRGGKELVDLFKRIRFTEAQFRGPICNRLISLNQSLKSGALDPSLRFGR